jgi:hypothetical protein
MFSFRAREKKYCACPSGQVHGANGDLDRAFDFVMHARTPPGPVHALVVESIACRTGSARGYRIHAHAYALKTMTAVAMMRPQCMQGTAWWRRAPAAAACRVMRVRGDAIAGRRGQQGLIELMRRRRARCQSGCKNCATPDAK